MRNTPANNIKSYCKIYAIVYMYHFIYTSIAGFVLVLAVATYNESKGSEHQTGLQGTNTHSNPPAPIPSDLHHGLSREQQLQWISFISVYPNFTRHYKHIFTVLCVASEYQWPHYGLNSVPPKDMLNPSTCECSLI